jgi:uncharacterized protein (DUF2384 family)
VSAQTLPQAAVLLRRWIASERAQCRRHRTSVGDDLTDERLRDLADYAQWLDAAVSIWNQEQEAVAQRIAARIRVEVPRAENCGIPDAVEQAHYAIIAP